MYSIYLIVLVFWILPSVIFNLGWSLESLVTGLTPPPIPLYNWLYCKLYTMYSGYLLFCCVVIGACWSLHGASSDNPSPGKGIGLVSGPVLVCFCLCSDSPIALEDLTSIHVDYLLYVLYVLDLISHSLYDVYWFSNIRYVQFWSSN